MRSHPQPTARGAIGARGHRVMRAPTAHTVVVSDSVAVLLFSLILAALLATYGGVGQDLLYNPIHTGVENEGPYAALFNRARYLAVAAGVGAAFLGRTFYRSFLIAAPLLPFALFAATSTLWTADVTVTGRASFLLLGFLLSSAALVDRIGVRTAMSVLLHFLAVIVLASVALAVVAPEIGRHSAGDALELTHVGLWRGVFAHKNALGFYAAVASILLFIQPGASRRWRLYFWAAGLCALACLAMSGSANAIGGAAVGWGAYLVLRSRATAHPLVLVGVAIFGGALVLAASAGAAQVAALLGRDPTFTGRTEIWTAALKLIAQKPLEGYGYVAGDTHVLAPVLMHQLFPSAVDAHNGYLELLLGVGVIGTGLFLAGVFIALRGAYRLILGTPSPTRSVAVGMAAVLFASMAMAMGEVSPFRPVGNGGQVLLIALVVMLAMAPKNSRRRKR